MTPEVWRARRWKEKGPDASMQYSGIVVLEKITAPASRKRAAGGASFGAGTGLTLAAPKGTGWPLVAILSLVVTGTPSSVPIGSAVCPRPVQALWVARPPAGADR